MPSYFMPLLIQLTIYIEDWSSQSSVDFASEVYSTKALLGCFSGLDLYRMASSTHVVQRFPDPHPRSRSHSFEGLKLDASRARVGVDLVSIKYRYRL